MLRRCTVRLQTPSQLTWRDSQTGAFVLMLFDVTARLVPFKHTKEDAVTAVTKVYEERSPGYNFHHSLLGSPRAVWLTFFGCTGTVTGSFRADIKMEGGVVDTVGPYTVSTPVKESMCTIYAGTKLAVSPEMHEVGKQHLALTQRQAEAADAERHQPLDVGAEIDEKETNARILAYLQPLLDSEAERLFERKHQPHLATKIDWISRDVELTQSTKYYLPAFLVPFKYRGEDYPCVVGGESLKVLAPDVWRPQEDGKGGFAKYALIAALFAVLYVNVKRPTEEELRAAKLEADIKHRAQQIERGLEVFSSFAKAASK